MSHRKSDTLIKLSLVISAKIKEAIESIEGNDRKGIQKKIKKVSRKIASKLLKPVQEKATTEESTISEHPKVSGTRARKANRKSIINPATQVKTDDKAFQKATKEKALKGVSRKKP